MRFNEAPALYRGMQPALEALICLACADCLRGLLYNARQLYTKNHLTDSRFS